MSKKKSAEVTPAAQADLFTLTLTLPAHTEEQAHRLARQASAMFAEITVSVTKNAPKLEPTPEPSKPIEEIPIARSAAPGAARSSEVVTAAAAPKLEESPSAAPAGKRATDKISGITVLLVDEVGENLSLQQIDPTSGENIGVPYACPRETFSTHYEEVSAAGETSEKKPAAKPGHHLSPKTPRKKPATPAKRSHSRR